MRLSNCTHVQIWPTTYMHSDNASFPGRTCCGLGHGNNRCGTPTPPRRTPNRGPEVFFIVIQQQIVTHSKIYCTRLKTWPKKKSAQHFKGKSERTGKLKKRLLIDMHTRGFFFPGQPPKVRASIVIRL